MKIDYHNIETVTASPSASSMIESFRAIGYSVETAIADIIDNSISAGASKIWINKVWNGADSFITIKDNGCGMNGHEIIQAMRPGCQNPLDTRSKTDLGRFGLGLKTASFSQCRKLTVLSKKADFSPIYWTWDLDYIAQKNTWDLIKWIPEGMITELNDLENGTLVVWSDLDRIIKKGTLPSDAQAKKSFATQMDRVRNHIAMIFHRFIEDNQVKIFWASHAIEPWNPFCPLEEGRRQAFSVDRITGGVEIKGYVLPHKNAFSSEEAFWSAQGANGWPAQQGFYVYRGKRMLLGGDWLGLFRKEEHYKLARIQIDLPNSLDSDWQIDIKKSRAYPPSSCRESLKAYAMKIRNEACQVFRHREKVVSQRLKIDFTPLWETVSIDGKWSFRINRQHTLIKKLKELAATKPDKAFNNLLKIVEETIPSKTIYMKEAQDEENEKLPFEGQNIDWLKEILEQVYANFISDGLSPKQAKASLRVIEPFNKFETLIDSL